MEGKETWANEGVEGDGQLSQTLQVKHDNPRLPKCILGSSINCIQNSQRTLN